MKYLKLFENYTRVIPRDFFNEAKLLKCMGLLALKIHDSKTPEGITIEISENGEPVDIDLVLSDHAISVINYLVTVNGQEVIMKNKYNSRENYPMYCEVDEEDFLVFNEQGEFTTEFIERFKNENSL